MNSAAPPPIIIKKRGLTHAYICSRIQPWQDPDKVLSPFISLELIEKYRCRLVVTTPTFARSMLRRAHAHSYDSVDYFIVGAEKLQPELSAEYRERFHLELLEGYGLTEASPVCSVNLPDVPPTDNCRYYIPGRVAGSVGAPLPGIAVRITDTDEVTRRLPLTEQGMIWLKGANIFSRLRTNSQNFKIKFQKRSRTNNTWPTPFQTLN